MMILMKKEYPKTYYSATAHYTLNTSELTDKLEVDTCIIGAGYAGLMTALSLVERGHTDIAIIDKNRVGWGCSGRNGGFVFGGYSLGPRALVKHVGEHNAKELYQLTKSAIDLIRKRVKKYHIECDLIDSGVLWANWFKDQSLLLKEQHFMQQKMGVEWQYLTPMQLSMQLKTERYHGGLFEPNAMHFHPLNYALGVAQYLISKGVKIVEECPALDINYHQPVKVVNTSQGKIHCKNIVIAGGGYIGKLCKPVSRSILPIATYVMATESLGSELNHYINTQSAVYDTRFAFDYYRPLPDNRILWGGRINANTQKPTDLEHMLQRDLAKVFPQLKDIKIDFAWDGWMAYARHQMSQIGELAPGVWYGIGFGGHGVAPTTVAGEMLAAAISQENNDYQMFRPWGLPWNGGIFGPPAAQASYWWYQFKDWLKEKLED